MLVLLIIFMISAPLLTAGVPVELPKTEAASIQDQNEPLTVSIKADGSVFIGDRQTPFSSLSPQLREMSGSNTRKPIYVRADGRASYAIVAQVMASLSTSGFTSINLITDTGGPSSGPKEAEAAPEAAQP
jgi:biopolymer transport protein TolR